MTKEENRILTADLKAEQSRRNKIEAKLALVYKNLKINPKANLTSHQQSIVDAMDEVIEKAIELYSI